jgi:hypothetical protein
MSRFHVVLSIILLSFQAKLIVATYIIENCIVNNNYECGNVTLKYWNQKDRPVLVNVKVRYNYDFSKMIVYYRMNLQKNREDKEYQWEIIRTTFNLRTLSRTLEVYPLLKPIFGKFASLFNGNNKFPMKKVKFNILESNHEIKRFFKK